MPNFFYTKIFRSTVELYESNDVEDTLKPPTCISFQGWKTDCGAKWITTLWNASNEDGWWSGDRRIRSFRSLVFVSSSKLLRLLYYLQDKIFLCGLGMYWWHNSSILTPSKPLLVPFLANQFAMSACREYLAMAIVLTVNMVFKWEPLDFDHFVVTIESWSSAPVQVVNNATLPFCHMLIILLLC